MVSAPGPHEILAEPLQPGVFRVCVKCRSWFAQQGHDHGK